MKRNATAVWNGTGKEGNGNLTTQTATLNKVQYSWNSRFAEGIGTNPEELIAAAHAGCFSMKLSFILGTKNFTPESIETNAAVTIDSGAITSSHLVVTAKVPGMSNEDFQAAAIEAKDNCPVSKVLNAAITIEAKLI
ncbi:MAG: OsmC family protein [Pseudomonadota bacterium]